MTVILSIIGLLGTIFFALMDLTAPQIGMQFTGLTILFAAIFLMGTVGGYFQQLIKLQKETNILLAAHAKK